MFYLGTVIFKIVKDEQVQAVLNEELKYVHTEKRIYRFRLKNNKFLVVI